MVVDHEIVKIYNFYIFLHALTLLLIYYIKNQTKGEVSCIFQKYINFSAILKCVDIIFCFLGVPTKILN